MRLGYLLRHDANEASDSQLISNVGFPVSQNLVICHGHAPIKRRNLVSARMSADGFPRSGGRSSSAVCNLYIVGVGGSIYTGGVYALPMRILPVLYGGTLAVVVTRFMLILLEGGCTVLYIGEPDADGVRLIRVYPEYLGGV